jgi:hypothetical protein
MGSTSNKLSTLDQLSPKERAAIARLHGTEGFAALKKLHSLTVEGLGKDALVAQSMEDVKFLSGRAYQSKILVQAIIDLYKAEDKPDNKK